MTNRNVHNLRDAELPGLDLLLNPDRMLTLLQTQLPAQEWTAVRPVYIRYKPGMNCLVGYRGEADGQAVDLYAKALRPAHQAKLNKSSSGEEDMSPRQTRVVPNAGVLISLFPHDLKLPVLRRLHLEEPRNALMRRLWHTTPDWQAGTLHTLRYKPERRLVVRYEVADLPVAALKFYTGRGYATAYAQARVFASHGPLRVARRLARSNRHRILAFEWLPGRLLSNVIRAGQGAIEEAERVGEALALLHRTPVPAQAPLLDPVPGVAAVAESLKWIRPDRYTMAQGLAGRLAQQTESAASVYSVVHGDFYAKQVIMQPQHVGLIDFDGSGVAPAATDLGNFVAHLERDAIRGYIDADTVATVRAGLIRGYNRAAAYPVTERTVNLHTAVGLFKLVPHPFRFLEAHWAHQIERLLQRTAALLPETGLLKCTASPTGARVHDPYNVLQDEAHDFLAPAFNPAFLHARAGHLVPAGSVLDQIEVRRHKPGRRSLLAFTWQRPGSVNPDVLLGKARVKGLDHATFSLMQALYQGGWGPGAEPEGGLVPEPLGCIPELRLWMQRAVSGQTLSALLHHSAAPEVMVRAARAVRRLHQEGPPPKRSHTLADELALLADRLGRVRPVKPACTLRLDRVLHLCRQAATPLHLRPMTPIHRDYYPDNLLWDGQHLYLLDFDLYTRGDPALDAGNFIGHLMEMGLREAGTPAAFAPLIHAFEEAFMEGESADTQAAVSVCTTLTLARHIYISTTFAERRPFTEALLRLCEDRLSTVSDP